MKKNLLFLILFLAVFFFGANSALAQTNPEKVFYVEFFVPDGLPRFSHKFEVPADFDFEKSLIGGGFATTGCLNCPLSAEYQFWIFNAEKITDEKMMLAIDASFKNKRRCNTRREIYVNPQKRETINLKCGVKLITYSAIPDKPV